MIELRAAMTGLETRLDELSGHRRQIGRARLLGGGMTLQKHYELILALARVLFVNGQSTERTVTAVEKLAKALEFRVEVMPRWGELQVEVQNQYGTLFSRAANPTGVDMHRVAAAMSTIAKVGAGRLAPDSALRAISTISNGPLHPTWLFALAAAAGAVALAVIYGIEHLAAAGLILVSAAAGAVVRRALAQWTTNVLVQPFCAALLAGIIGGLAVRFDLSSSLRLVAVCPCMVLVPGPHLLNGVLDLVNGRIHLGAARLLYALLVVVAISTGLLLGLAIMGVSLPVDPTGRSVPLWQDVLAAGVAVFAFSVFFSMPLRMLAWPLAIGMLAHALRWAAISVLGMGVATGALVACFVGGAILTPVSHRRHMPFAAIGFASVVSLMPGIYIFRMASGLVQIVGASPTTAALLSEMVSNGMTALMIILAMSLGLIVPKMLIESVYEKRQRPRSLEPKEHADVR
jgi:uncharacterized membrane protein YjjP (DUF1212 family)